MGVPTYIRRGRVSPSTGGTCSHVPGCSHSRGAGEGIPLPSRSLRGGRGCCEPWWRSSWWEHCLQHGATLPGERGGFSLPRETPEGLVCCGCAFIVTGLRGWVWPSPRAEPCQTHRSHGNWQPAGRAPRCFPAAELSPAYLLGSSPGDAACRLLQPLARAPSSAGDALNKNFKIKPFPEHPGAWRPGCPPPTGSHAAGHMRLQVMGWRGPMPAAAFHLRFRVWVQPCAGGAQGGTDAPAPLAVPRAVPTARSHRGRGTQG